MLNERSSATVLVRLALFLRKQRSDAVGELRAERCLEPATISLGEFSDEAFGEIAADCCFEAVEGGCAIVLTPMHLLYVEAQPRRCRSGSVDERGGGAHSASMGSDRASAHPSLR